VWVGVWVWVWVCVCVACVWVWVWVCVVCCKVALSSGNNGAPSESPVCACVCVYVCVRVRVCVRVVCCVLRGCAQLGHRQRAECESPVFVCVVCCACVSPCPAAACGGALDFKVVCEGGRHTQALCVSHWGIMWVLKSQIRGCKSRYGRCIHTGPHPS